VNLFKMPDIGQFRFPLGLYQPTQGSTDTGQASYSFVHSATVPAHVKNIRGQLTDDGEQEMAGRRTYRFIIRDGSGFDYGWEIEYESVRYRPERIDGWDERGRFQIIYAIEVDL
jgi:head-tail adaptor